MKRIYMFLLSIVIISSLLISGCEDKSDLTAPAAPSTGNADFSRFVTIGNSLTAGYMNGGLYQSGQEYSYGNQIAKQVQTSFEQPIYSDPGTPGRFEVQSVSPFALTVNTSSGTPTNTTYASPYNNLGVPGSLLAEILTAKNKETSLTQNPMFDLVLRGIGTMTEQATALQPTVLTCWLGNNDILGYASRGGTVPHTPEAAFTQVYTLLGDALAATGAKVVVANIPSISTAPYFTTVGPAVGQAIQAAMGANPAVLGLFYQKNGEVIASGLASPTDLFTRKVMVLLTGSSYAALIGQPTDKFYTDNGITTLPPGIDTSQPFGLHPQNPWPDALTLDADEQAIVGNVVTSYNNTIASVAAAKGFAVMDANALLRDVADADGYTTDGIKFSAAYVSGGLFSLDGVHPTAQGYAVIANQFIRVFNSTYNAQIPLINVATVPGSFVLAKSVKFDKYGIPIIPPGMFDNLQF